MQRPAVARRPAVTAAAALIAALAPALGLAAGFETEYPDNGARALGRAGAFTARADDPSAIYHNPAGLTRLSGTNLYVSANLMSLDQTFQPADRTVGQVPAYTLGYGEIAQSAPPFVAPFLACQFDFDALPDLDFAAGIYGPASNGHRKFDRQYPVRRATYVDRRGEVKDATARIAGTQAVLTPNGMLVESELVQLFPTLSAAWRLPFAPVRLGVSLQDSIVLAKLKQGSGGTMPGQAELDVRDLFAPTGVFGVLYAPHPRVEIGLSLRPPISIDAHGTAKLRRYAACPQDAAGECKAGPALTDTFPFDGTLPLYGADGKSPEDGVTMRFENPLWARLGVRYVHRDAAPPAADGAPAQDELSDPGLFDVELDYLYERDSTHQAYELSFDATYVNIPNTQDASAQGTNILMPHQRDVRNYQDTHALRLGGDYNVLPGRLAVRAGAAYETAVSSANYTHLDFPSTPKLTGAVGVGYTIADLVELDLGVSYTEFLEVTEKTSEIRITDVQTAREDWAVIGNGTFGGHYLVLGLSSSWHL